MKKLYRILGIMVMTFIIPFTNALAYETERPGNGNFTVQYDAFEESDAVNARFTKNLTLKDAIVYDNQHFYESFKKTTFSFSTESSDKAADYIFYYGPLNLGDHTTGAAVENRLAGSITLRWEDAILLSNGDKADFEIIISDIVASVRPYNPEHASLLAQIETAPGFYLPLLSNGVGAATDNVGVAIDESTHKIVSPKVGNTTVDINNGIRYKVTMKAYQNNHQFDTPLDGDIKILFGVQDLDVPSNIDGSIEAKLRNEYTEGIELVSGFGTIHSGYKTDTSNSYKLSNGYLRISPDADRASSLYTGNQINSDYDNNYLSGFLTSATISGNGSSFYWTGSNDCGTRLFTNFQVKINQTHNNGGTVNVHSNIASENKNLGSSTNEEYFSGSRVTYNYNPSKGYYVENVLVDNQVIPFDRNGSEFTFGDLIYNPLSPLSTSQSITREIAVQFAPYNFELHYINYDKTEDESLMPHVDMTYDSEGSIASNKYKNDDKVFVNWKLLDENKNEILDSDNNPIYLNSKDDYSKIYELDIDFDGTKLYLEAQYGSKVINPKTFDSNSTLFIIIKRLAYWVSVSFFL